MIGFREYLHTHIHFTFLLSESLTLREKILHPIEWGEFDRVQGLGHIHACMHICFLLSEFLTFEHFWQGDEFDRTFIEPVPVALMQTAALTQAADLPAISVSFGISAFR